MEGGFESLQVQPSVGERERERERETRDEGLRVMERPRSATSSFEVVEEGDGGAEGEEAREQQGVEAQQQEFNAYTDLDLLLARLEGDQQQGTNYDVSFALSRLGFRCSLTRLRANRT